MKIDFFEEVAPYIRSFRRVFGRNPTSIELNNIIREIHIMKAKEEV